MDTEIEKDNEELEIETGTDEERREALRKLGKYAYVAPVVTTVLLSEKASAASPIIPPPPPPPRKP